MRLFCAALAAFFFAISITTQAGDLDFKEKVPNNSLWIGVAVMPAQENNLQVRFRYEAPADSIKKPGVFFKWENGNWTRSLPEQFIIKGDRGTFPLRVENPERTVTYELQAVDRNGKIKLLGTLSGPSRNLQGTFSANIELERKE